MPALKLAAGRLSAGQFLSATDGAAPGAVQLGDWNAITSGHCTKVVHPGPWITCKRFAGPVTLSRRGLIP